MTRIDLSPLNRATIGFEHLFSTLDRLTEEAAPGYPPYNIEKTAEDAYRISLAVAGFTPEDIVIETRDGALSVVGRKAPEESGRVFLHRGIAERAFERRFRLAEHVETLEATMENGVLHITLQRRTPEALKPRRIAIRGAQEDGARDGRIGSAGNAPAADAPAQVGAEPAA